MLTVATETLELSKTRWAGAERGKRSTFKLILTWSAPIQLSAPESGKEFCVSLGTTNPPPHTSPLC